MSMIRLGAIIYLLDSFVVGLLLFFEFGETK